jgi:predicted permease
MRALFWDIRYTIRQLRKAPAFSTTAILTLAIGIGATTAIFTLVHSVLLSSLPVTKPEELWKLGDANYCCFDGGYYETNGDKPEFALFSYEFYRHLRDETSGFRELAAFEAGTTDIGVLRSGATGTTHPTSAEFVSGNYFRTFGVSAFAGRTLTPADDQRNAPPVAVMNYREWQQRYAGDASVVGSTFVVNGTPLTVVGITAPDFFGDQIQSDPPEFWIPLAQDPLLRGNDSVIDVPDGEWLDVIGRLAPGAQRSAVEARINVEFQQWLASHAADMDGRERTLSRMQSIHLVPGGAGITAMREHYASGLHLLMAVSGFVLLIVCANMANLLLVRSTTHRMGTSIRAAIGAPRSRLMRQALVESAVLGVFGGAVGIVVAYGGAQLLLRLAFSGEQAPPISASPSLPVLGFALAVSLLTSALFGIAPAWMAARANPIEALRGANRGTRDASELPRRTLVILQTALSVVLISAAALLTQSLRHLNHQDYGFAQAGRIDVHLNRGIHGYRPEQYDVVYRRIADRLRQIPGVLDATYASYAPMGNDMWNGHVFIAGAPPPPPGSQWNRSASDRIGADYFSTTGIRILEGRPIEKTDTATSRRVAVVNEAFARRFFSHESPIGKHFGEWEASHSGDFEIVGVAADARYFNDHMHDPVGPMFFISMAQWTDYTSGSDRNSEIRSHLADDFILSTRGGDPRLEAKIRQAFADVDPNLTIRSLRTFTEQVSGNFTREALVTRLTALLGLLALLLAAIGLYGVTAHTVERRTAEIGIRMALGADRAAVLQMVLRGALTQVAFGIAIGLPAAVLAAKGMRSELYGVAAYSPVLLASTALVLFAAACLAALLPARRAASIEPVIALRSE